jgi:hypothetical protein
MTNCDSFFPFRCFSVLMTVLRMITLGKMRKAVHVTRMGGTGNSYSVFIGKPEVKVHLHVRGVYGSIVLWWIVSRLKGRGLDSFDAGLGQSAD